MAELADLLRRSAGRGLQNIQYAMPEALRNYVGKAEWDEKKNAQDFYGGDFEAQERADKFGGFGTDAGGMIGAIKAYHGSPYKFDRFDMSKIGSGEGAQAYGHGLYFAESPKVAKEYMKVDPMTTLPPRRLFQGQELEPGTPEYHAATLVQSSPLKSVRKEVQGWIDALGDQPERAKDVEGYQRTLEILNLANSKGDFKTTKPKPNFYETSLKWPDAAREAADPLGEHHLLDWDAPLSEQPKGVRKALASLNDPYVSEALSTKPASMDEGDYWKYLGNTYDSMREALDDATPAQLITGSRGSFKSPKDASERLRQAGIPGIRYLDGGSRSAGKGTRNYVIFDDQIPEVVSRNGQAIAEALRGAK